MEDPWSSPWATDTPAPPTIDLPSEPQQAHVVNTPRKTSRSPSPWGRNVDEAEDDWGGWKEASAGKDTPGWGRSPNLRPLGSATVLDPWALGAEEKERERGADSAISLGEDGRDTRDEETNGKAVEGHVMNDEEANAMDWHGTSEKKTGEAVNGLNVRDEKTHEIQEQISIEDIRVEDIDRSTSPDIDEPTKALGVERPTGSRQPSKVQELVEMYDGMARAPSAEISSSETGQREVDDDELQDEIEHATTLEVSYEMEKADTALDEDIADDTHHDSEESTSSETDEDDISQTEAPEIDEPTQSLQADEPKHETLSVEPVEPTLAQDSEHNTATLPQPTSYAIDFSILDTLFPGIEVTTTIPEQLPESIIKESFDSVSQRKAWYRMSRFGSIRSHNHGDDDNYVRVGWNNSTVRKDTLSTVRRWMEEDSIGGRVILGRRLGHGGGSMFNWDSEAPAVEIGELLARKKPKPKPKPTRHTRQVSATVEGTVMSPTIPAFGWSSSVPASPVTGRFSSEWHAKPSRLGETSEAPLTAQVINSQADAVEAEDDDWGEMVSSPTMESSEVGMGSIAETLQVPVVPSQDSSQSVNTTIESDPWGGLDMFGGSSLDKQESVSPTLSTATPTSPTFTKHNPTSAPALNIIQSTSEAQTEHASSPKSSRRTSFDLPSQADNEAVATILAGIPDLSYMLK